MNWYFDAWKQYAIFSGTASREAFWAFILVNSLMSVGFVILEITFQMTWKIEALYSLLLFLPMLSLTVRRLHDTNRSAWWLLVALVPVIGVLLLLVLLALPSEPESNDNEDMKISANYIPNYTLENQLENKNKIRIVNRLPNFYTILCSSLLVLLLFSIATSASVIKTTNTHVSKEIKGVVYISSPHIGTLLHLRGIAGKGVLISRKKSTKQGDAACLSTPIRFAAGDFNGSNIGIHATEAIRLAIYSGKVMSKLMAGDEVVSKHFNITDQSEEKLGDINIESGLTLSYGFVLNPGEWSWASLLGTGQEKVDCELIKEVGSVDVK